MEKMERYFLCQASIELRTLKHGSKSVVGAVQGPAATAGQIKRQVQRYWHGAVGAGAAHRDRRQALM